MLDITLCYSILEFCFDNLNIFEKDNVGAKVLQTIEQHHIIFHNDLGKEYMQYFEQSRLDLEDQYQSFINSIIPYDECIKIIDFIPSCNEIDNITTDRYLNMLFNICYRSSDRCTI